MQRSHCGGDVLTRRLFEHILTVIDDIEQENYDDIQEIYDDLTSIIIDYEQKNNVGKSGETK
tara:strand:+ start:41 stop:226 length:186 start_codon:yes stop_codon:yes gene_type:complete